MLVRSVALIAVALLSAQAVSGQQPLPPPIAAGLDSLQKGRCEAAFHLWASGWTSSEDVAKRQTLVGGCEMLARLGPLRGHDIIRTVDVGPHLKRVYALLRYENQPVYLLVVAYRPHDRWKIASVNWHTRSEHVYPPDILPAEKPTP
jgi:hypothetical protein